MYEKFRKSRSVPASNFDFSPYQELSTGYYNFQGDRRKIFFDLDGRKTAAKTTMPYFLCTDHAQAIFSMGHKVFIDDFELLFLGGDWTAHHRTRIEEFSKEHGLFHADEWLEQAKSIREYRPSLDRKQKRILHDELCSSRNEWIELCHKRDSSVIIYFDPNSSITEHEIDRYFASLVDIKSIYLPRDLDGSLKGMASLVCASHTAAQQLLALFKVADPRGFSSNQGYIEPYLDANGKIALKARSDLSKIKKDFLKAAAQWLHINRQIWYEEFIVPFYWPCSVPSTASKEQYLTFLLMRWHQERHRIGQNQSQLEQDREKCANLQAELKTNPEHIYFVNFVSRGSQSQGLKPADVLQDDKMSVKMMYFVVKNGQGHTLYKWMGKQAPFREIHQSGYVAVRDFVQSNITENFDVNETVYEKKDDLSKAIASSSQSRVPVLSPQPFDDLSKAIASSSQSRVPVLSPQPFDASWKIEILKHEMLREFLSDHTNDWIAFECTAGRDWMERREENKQKDGELAKLQADAMKCDMKFECDIRIASRSMTSEYILSSDAKSPMFLNRFGQKVFCFKANNEAQARRLKQMLPSLDAPNHTVLWSRTKPTHTMSISDGKGSTVSVIAREDVTDASVLQFLQKILKKNVLPSICGVSEVPLRACEDKTDIQWLDIHGDVIKARKWNRRSFRFRSQVAVEYQYYLEHAIRPHQHEDHRLQDIVTASQILHPLMPCSDVVVLKADVCQPNIDEWERECFYQPFSQPVLDLILLKGDFSVYRKLNFDIKNMVETKLTGEILDPKLQLIVIVSDSEKISLCVSLKNGNAQILREKFEGFFIEMDQKCLVNFLFSDVLVNQSIETKFRSILECGKDFWGKLIKFSWNTKKEKDDDEVQFAVHSFWNIVLKKWSNLAVLSVLQCSVLTKEGAKPVEIRKNEGDSRHKTRMEHVSCCYCGCNYVISSSIKTDFGSWDGFDDDSVFCCINHVDFSKKVQPKVQLPISSFKTKSDKVISRQAQDPARDKNLANLFQRICEIEKLLLLNISVGAQYMLFFKCSKTNKLSQMRMQCRFRRDKYDGPVHVSFCIEGPTAILCRKTPTAIMCSKIKGGHAADDSNQQEWSLKAGLGVTISLCRQMDGFTDFSTTLSVDPEFHEHETPLLFGLDTSSHKMKTRMSRIYGRLAPKHDGKENGISSENEGNKLPAEWMRRLMEPEYYQCPKAVYPVVEFKLIVPSGASNEVASHTYCAVAASFCFEEHGLSDKHSKQDLKPKMDDVSQALRCFREVLDVESKLNAVTSSLNQLNQQIGACLHVADLAAPVAAADNQDSVPSVGDEDDDDNQYNGSDDYWSTDHFESRIPQSGWIVLLRTDSKIGTWMDMFHARRKTDRAVFEDIIRVIVEFPTFKPEDNAPPPLSPLVGLYYHLAYSKSKKLKWPLLHFKSMISKEISGFLPRITFNETALQQFQTFCPPEIVEESPLAALAKSFIDYVIPKIPSDVPICVFKQIGFPDHLSTFIFGEQKMKLVSYEVSKALFHGLSKLPLRLDLDFQLDMKQKYFDKTLAVLLSDEEQKDSIKSESKEFGALVACKTINETLDFLKLLEVFKFVYCSDSMFCKVSVALVFIFFFMFMYTTRHLNWISTANAVFSDPSLSHRVAVPNG